MPYSRKLLEVEFHDVGSGNLPRPNWPTPPLYLSEDAFPSGRLIRFLRAAHEPQEEAMEKVYLSLSMSLDGFITGPNPRPEDRRRRLALYVLCLGC